MALMLLLLLVGAGALAALVTGLNRSNQSRERDGMTYAALAQAKTALVGYAAGHATRGRFPCPEDASLVGTANEGNERSSCNGNGLRIGRLPWRTLGVGDVRDANGERLWYAVSANFTNDAAKINSDVSAASLSVNGVAGFSAVVFSSGTMLAGQVRNSVAAPCVTTGTSLRHDYCADNYLDVDVLSTLSNRDGNTTFVSAEDSRRTLRSDDMFNDMLIAITPGEFFKAVENRVLNQVKSCLTRYANDSGNPAHLYPWAHNLNTLASPYNDVDGLRMGRLARDLHAENNPAAWNGDSCPLYCSAACPAASKNWFNDWKELVFYAVAEKYAPSGSGDSPGGTLLTVGANSNVRAVVFLAHPPLSGQFRTTNAQRIALGNYLEGANVNGDDDFSNLLATPSYNDRTLIVAP